MTDEESTSSPQPELHAATGHAMIGLLGPPDQLQDFLEKWVQAASDCALVLVAEYPDIMLIPIEDTDDVP